MYQASSLQVGDGFISYELQKLIADSSSPEQVVKKISKHPIFSVLYDKMLAGKWDNADPNLPTDQKRINSIV